MTSGDMAGRLLPWKRSGIEPGENKSRRSSIPESTDEILNAAKVELDLFLSRSSKPQEGFVMFDDPRRQTIFRDDEADYFDQDWDVPDEVLERNQPLEELGGAENQPTNQEEDENFDEPDLVPLWNLL